MTIKGGFQFCGRRNRLHRNGIPRVLKVFWCAFFTAVFTVAPSPAQDRITVRFSGQAESYSLSSVQRHGVDYAPLEELADLLGIGRYTNPQNKKTLYRSGDRTLKIISGNPFFLLDDDAFQMALPTLDLGGKTYVPLILFIESSKSFFHVRFDYDPQKRSLRVSQINENITGIEIFDKGNGTVVKLSTSRTFKPSDVSASLSDGWLNVTCYGGALDSAFLSSAPVSGLIREIRPYQFAQSAQISFRLSQAMADRSVNVEPNAVYISAWSSERSARTPLYNPAADKQKWAIDCIVLDPGHGGLDPGAIGPSKLKEKEVTMDIALRLKTLLKNRLPGVSVLLTRENDMFLGLKERTQFANANRGKLFISIHTDANQSRSVRGFTTYLLGMSRTPEAIEAAQKENSVVQMEASSEAYKEFQDASYILNSIAQSSYLKESQDLAQMINQALRKAIGIPDLGMHKCGFWVLVGAAMPSVLVETAFISNREEERLLKTRSFRQKIAEGLCESIGRFKNRYEMEIR
jgi:N-acetylmuramoyl-L-alanine amidase